MVRPFRHEVVRYGEYSKAGEFVYDHPFLWGSKRTGPDLHREGRGNKNAKSNSWHYYHMLEPQSMSSGSIMPAYPWLITKTLDTSLTEKKIAVMRKLGVPYTDEDEQNALTDLRNQAVEIRDNLKESDIDVSDDKEIIALIAYLQRLGTDILEKEEGDSEGITQK